jgi:protease I
MKKIVLVVAHKDYRDEEYANTRSALEAEGVGVSVASTDLGEAEGVKGGRAKVDVLLREVSAADYDGIAFIGGPGSKSYVGHAVASNLAREFLSEGKVVGAICYAPAILAKAGILSGRNATGWKTDDNREVEELIIREGGIYSDNSVVVDSGVVTAFNHLSAGEFGKALAGML